MKITLNKNKLHIPNELMLNELIEKLGVKHKRPVIQINGKSIDAEASSFALNDGDDLSLTLLGYKMASISTHGLPLYIYIQIRKLLRFSTYFKIFWLTILNYIKPIEIVNYKGTNIQFYCPNRNLRLRSRGFMQKEPETINWIDSFPKGSVLWDIGAHIGIVSLYAKTRGANVLSFEPLHANYSILCKNINNNHFSEYISAFNIALSNKTKLDYLYVASEKAGASGNTFGKASNQNGDEYQARYKQPLLGYKIADFITEFNIPVPNYIKLDVDGIEYEILEGAKNILGSPVLKSILVEISILKIGVRDQIINLLEDNGFQLKSMAGVSVSNNTVFPIKGTCFNHIFEKTPSSRF